MKIKLPKFVPGESYIPVSGKIFDKEEIALGIQAVKDGWWTEGRFAKEFEDKFKEYLGVRYVSLVNSGSSANLVALASLTSKVFRERRLMPGDEFITAATGFPTTLNPGLLYGLKPVFLDIELDSLNIDVAKLEKAITPKTKLIMIAHTLGKPFNLEAVQAVAKKHKLWLIEDCCDALGTTYDGKLVGTFGDIATFSFYPAHQITMGEGGAVITSNPLINKSIRQFRDWGRDCWCDTGKDNSCGKRFKWKMGELPDSYDHKYIYSQVGFNLKLTEFGPAIGLAQLKKLPLFIEKRRENFMILHNFFRQYEKCFSLMKIDEREKPCWFGFPLIVKEGAPFTRNEFTGYLEAHKIGTRNIFAGNLLRQPAYCDKKFKTMGKMKNSDAIMNSACWLGVFPGIDGKRMKYILQTIEGFLAGYDIKKTAS